MNQWFVSWIKTTRHYRWPFPWVVCFLPVGMDWFCERGVVITYVPGTAPVGKQVYFYHDHIVKEKTGRNGKRLSSHLYLQDITQSNMLCYSADSLQMYFVYG